MSAYIEDESSLNPKCRGCGNPIFSSKCKCVENLGAQDRWTKASGLYILNNETRKYIPVPPDWLGGDWEENLPRNLEALGEGKFGLIADAGYSNAKLHPSAIMAYIVTLPDKSQRWFPAGGVVEGEGNAALKISSPSAVGPRLTGIEEKS